MTTRRADGRRNHAVAWWAGTAAFFGSLMTIGAIEVINPDQLIKFASSVVVALITAGAVYSKERLQDARRIRNGKQQMPDNEP